MTRVTVELDDDVLGFLEQRAVDEKRSVSEVLSDVLRDVLRDALGDAPAKALLTEEERAERVRTFKWISQPMHAMIDLEDHAAVAAALAGDR